MEIRAIETEFKGYKFRSRLEARWAVFFEALKIPWEYEKEGFDLEGVPYLPDFWLPRQKCWIEIKGQYPTSEETDKCMRLAEATAADVFIFCGPIPTPDGLFLKSEYDSAHKCFADGGWDCGHAWCECPTCGSFGIEFGGSCDRLECHHAGDISACSPKLLNAYAAAKSARFEHFKGAGG